MKTIAADKVLNTTNVFLHWKKLTMAHYPRAQFIIGKCEAVARIGGTHDCAHWDAIMRKGVVLHNPERI
jgi:hypothetical protein